MRNIVYLLILLCTACATAISQNLYQEFQSIDKVLTSNDYESAKQLIDRVEDGIGTKYTSPIDKKMIYDYKGAVLTYLNNYEEAISYYRLASDIKTDRADLEVKDLTNLIKLCATVQKEDCAKKAYRELPQAVALYKRDGEAELILDFRYYELQGTGIPVHVTFDIDNKGIPKNITAQNGSESSPAINEALKLAAMLRYIPNISNGNPTETSGVAETIYIKREWVNG